MMPLQGAGLEDCDWYSPGNGNLYARFFVDPSVDTSNLVQPDSGGGKEGAGKHRTAADTSAGTRSVFNFSIMFGGSFAFFQMRRTVAVPGLCHTALNIETKK